MTKLTQAHAIRCFSMAVMAAVAGALLAGCAAGKPGDTINRGAGKGDGGGAGKTWRGDPGKDGQGGWGGFGGGGGGRAGRGGGRPAGPGGGD